MTFALLLAVFVQSAPPVVSIQPPASSRSAPPVIRPAAPPMLLAQEDFSADSFQRMRALNDELRAKILPANEQSLNDMRAAESAFRDAAQAPVDRERLLAAADANDRARRIPVGANRRWVELALSLKPADRDKLLRALPTPSGQIFLRSAGSSPATAMVTDSARSKALRALRDMLGTPSPERSAAKAEELATLRRARALAADPAATPAMIAAAFDAYAEARARLVRLDTQLLGRLIATLPTDQRAVLTDLLPSSTP